MFWGRDCIMYTKLWRGPRHISYTNFNNIDRAVFYYHKQIILQNYGLIEFFSDLSRSYFDLRFMFGVSFVKIGSVV